jgi:hypothetical protein
MKKENWKRIKSQSSVNYVRSIVMSRKYKPSARRAKFLRRKKAKSVWGLFFGRK